MSFRFAFGDFFLPFLFSKIKAPAIVLAQRGRYKRLCGVIRFLLGLICFGFHVKVATLKIMNTLVRVNAYVYTGMIEFHPVKSLY